jgi:hypothetical protein
MRSAHLLQCGPRRSSVLQYPPCELNFIRCSYLHQHVLLFQDDDDEEDEDEVDNGFDDDEDDVEDDGDEVITLCSVVCLKQQGSLASKRTVQMSDAHPSMLRNRFC